jgi:hypothetical protein
MLVGGAFAACILGLVVLILMIQPPRPAAVVYVGADYATNLAVPHNVAGRNGIEKIRALSNIERKFTLFNSPWLHPLLKAPRILDRKDEWAKLIDELDKQNIREQTIVFVIALHGVTDSQGAYLLPNLATRPEDRLPLLDVIASLADKFRGKNKVLILEGSQTPSDWRQGMLQNDFARRLEELEPEIEKIDRLWVLSGCDVDQRCWTSEGLGSTVFSHYLAEALKGKAAGSDGRLYLDELHKYLARNVKDWVWSARGALQEPVLLPRTRRGGSEDDGVRSSDSSSRPGTSKVFLASAIAGAAPPPASAVVPNRDPLKQAWRSFHQLNAMTPHPSVYFSARWRLYRSALVRCEELVQAGDADSAEYLFSLLKGWDRDFAAERPLGLVKSIENSLAMNALQGGRISDPTPLVEFARFWEPARPDQLKKRWEQIEASASSASGGDAHASLSPRSRADLFLLGRAVRPGDLAQNLDRAAERVLIAKGDDYPQPAEAHFLRMLKLYLPLEGRPPDAQALVAQALMVRRQAERAALGIVGNESAADYPYCEQLHPWIGPLVEQADVHRRLGEDLLFATEEQAAKDAKEAFARAKVQYQSIAERASVVRSALAARDHVFAELPDYSRWLARRRPKDVADKLVERVRALWSEAHRLSARLATPSATASIDDLAALTSPKAGVGAGLEEVAGKFVDHQREYDADRRPEDWEAASAAAAVAFPDNPGLALRETIWARLDNIRRKDVELAAKLDPSQVSSSSRDESLQYLRSRTRVEGEMALAALGQTWYDDQRAGAAAAGNFAQDVESLENAKADKDPRQALAVIGERVGGRTRAIERRLAELLDKEDALNDLKSARDRLPDADRLARMIDAHTPLPAPGEPALRPSWRLRKLRGHDVLNWLARRAWLDHWYDENPTANPYYRAVGSRFVQDALGLFPKSPEAAEAQKILDAKDGLRFDEPKPVLFTSDLRRDVTYRLVETGTVPEGVPVVKPVPDATIQVEGGGREGYRMVSRRTDGEGAGQSIAFTLSSPRVRQAETDPKLVVPRADLATFRVRGFFRGQVFERPTPVEIDPIPEVVMAGPGLPNPPAASLAVRSSEEVVSRFGEGNGSIAIVLDCSGSMVEAGSHKFEEAKRSLINVLKQLPPKTRLSIWVFGQAAEGFDRDRARDVDLNQRDKPEETIRLLRPAAPWDRADLEPLSKALDGLIPFHGTPLLQAMWGAKLDLDKAKGLKTMLVLTDGQDTRFAENRTFNPAGATISGFIRENFKDAGITVNMIFFKLDDKQLKEARDQFEEAIGQLDPAGHFFTAQDEERLLATLQRSIKQKLTCRVVGSDGKTAGELDVTSPNEDARWASEGLKPGSYTLKVQADKTYERGVDLEQGDRLIVRLISDGGGIDFERALYSDDFPLRKDSGDAGGWRYSAARTRYQEQEPMGPLQLFTILEPTAGDTGRLRQARPRFAWFELSPQAGRGEFAVRWQELGAFPAPVWRGDVPRWLADPNGKDPAGPTLDAWWLAGKEADQDIGPAPLEFNRPQDVRDEVVRSDDGTTAIVESITTESHPIRTRADRDAPEQVDCLVVRLRYPRGKPFFVDPRRLPGITPSGYEHRFYLRAGAYTGLFGPITRTEVDSLRSLNLVPVAKLKALAEGRRQVAELKLAKPRTDDRIPEPPQAILKP